MSLVAVETPSHNPNWPARRPLPTPPHSPDTSRAISLSSAYVAASTSNQTHQNFIGGIRVPVNRARKSHQSMRPSTPPTSMPFRPSRQCQEPSPNIKLSTPAPPFPNPSPRLPRRPSTAPSQPQRHKSLSNQNNTGVEQPKAKTEHFLRTRMSFFSKLTKSKPDLRSDVARAVIVR